MLYRVKRNFIVSSSTYETVFTGTNTYVLIIAHYARMGHNVYTIMFSDGIVMQSTWNSDDLVNYYLEAL